MPKKNRKFLDDILLAIDLINDFKEGIDSYKEYHKDLKTKSAIERQLSIIGEAVVQYSKFEELQHSSEIRGFRNKLIHSYDSIDDAMVWIIVSQHLKSLHEEVKQKLEN